MVLIRWLEVEDRVSFLDPISRNEVIPFIASANVVVIPYPQDIPNYCNALPSKFFDYVMARLPIVAYKTPDTKKIVESHDIGVMLNSDSPETMAEAIRNVLEREEYYRANLEKIAPWYSWEMESRKLIDTYQRLLE